MGFLNKPLIRRALWVLVPAVVVLAILHRTRRLPASPQAAAPAMDAPALMADEKVHAQYAGSESCRECHQTAYAGWKTSNHGLAERSFSKPMDEQAFSPARTLVHGKDTSEISLSSDGVAQLLTHGPDNQRHAYPVERVIGNDPLRQFLVPAPGGRMQTCNVSYDPKKNEWFDVFGNEERNPGDWGHWTGQGMNWNAMCASCHNTRLRKNYEPRTNSYHTAMAEMSVGCEACHGPLKNHVEWQKNQPASGAAKDPTLRKLSRDQMLDTCGACHARRGELTGDLIPGEAFSDHFSLTLTDASDLYYPDGQVRDEDYEFSSFLSSKMHHAGIRCVDCHEPHTGKRLIPGNLLCMRCHVGGTQPPAPVIDPTVHSHHKAGSAGNECTACHMPVTHYMQRHPRHDHGMTIPDPLLTVEHGVPNACNRCHTDKDAAWALKAANAAYGEKLNRPTRTRALIIARARRGDASARKDLLLLLKSETIPAWQATTCHLLSRWVMDPETTRALLEQVSHPSPLVREAAIHALTQQVRQNNDTVRKALQPLLDDPVRAVRVAAAWALCATLDLKSKAGRELSQMLDLNADQPTGRMQLSQFAYLRGDTAAAIQQIRKAIEWDPNSPPFHHDLAILLSTTSDVQGAIQALETAVRLAPTDPQYTYKLALAWNEAGDQAKSAAALEQSVKLDPANARAWYNLGLARNALNQPQGAVAALLKGEAADPSDASIPYARATILARYGHRKEALEAASRALQLRQDYPEAIQLIQSLAH